MVLYSRTNFMLSIREDTNQGVGASLKSRKTMVSSLQKASSAGYGQRHCEACPNEPVIFGDKKGIPRSAERRINKIPMNNINHGINCWVLKRMYFLR